MAEATEDDREAERRAQFLERRYDFRSPKALALAYRELGYSHSGIARRIDSTEATVAKYMDAVADEFGPGAIETKRADEREGPLPKGDGEDAGASENGDDD